MLKPPKRNLISRLFFNHKFLALLGLSLIILISIPLAKNISQRYRVNREIRELEKEINQLENKNIDFKKFITYLESNQFIEEQARLKLGLKKPGEEVAVIQTPINEQKLATTTNSIFGLPQLETGVTKATTNPERWLKYFFK